ncbi:MAG: matrixin family metalloprotease, partial [Gaiellaceae bacterium]
GWNNCSGWNQCNVAEVATHELGHTIGLGHSADNAATMRASAHFDGRCAGLGTDDINAVNFIYPGTGGPVPTPPPTSPLPPPATNTPLPTATFTATPTFTPPPIHDSVVAPLRAMSVTIASGRTSATAKIHVKVTNADVLPFPEPQGHTTKLVASDGSCPAGTIVGLPDFDGSNPGDQDTVWLSGGKSKSASVTLNVDSAAFAALHQQMPMRCTLIFGAVVVQPAGSSDPTSANNAALMELNVVDRNAGGTVPQPVLKRVAPVKISIPRGRTNVTSKVSLTLGTDANGAPLNQTGTLTISDSNCPANALNAVNPVPGAVGSHDGTSKMSLVLTINSSAFATAQGKCPARCIATLTASGAGVDPQSASSISRLVIDVVDKNDF